jgi:hypothetical protein|tara:strand:- start:45 stop:326 length:282 start_codon:yes stop_codon:yes gene_type:complete
MNKQTQKTAPPQTTTIHGYLLEWDSDSNSGGVVSRTRNGREYFSSVAALQMTGELAYDDHNSSRTLPVPESVQEEIYNWEETCFDAYGRDSDW